MESKSKKEIQLRPQKPQGVTRYRPIKSSTPLPLPTPVSKKEKKQKPPLISKSMEDEWEFMDIVIPHLLREGGAHVSDILSMYQEAAIFSFRDTFEKTSLYSLLSKHPGLRYDREEHAWEVIDHDALYNAFITHYEILVEMFGEHFMNPGRYDSDSDY